MRADFFIFIADGFCCKYKLSKYLIRSKYCRPTITVQKPMNQWLLPVGLEKVSLILISYFRLNIEHGFLFDRFFRSCPNKCRPLGPGDPRLSPGLTFISFFSLQNNFSLDLKKGWKFLDEEIVRWTKEPLRSLFSIRR